MSFSLKSITNFSFSFFRMSFSFLRKIHIVLLSFNYHRGITNKLNPAPSDTDKSKRKRYAKSKIICKIGPIGGAAPGHSVQITAMPSPLMKSSHKTLTSLRCTRAPPSLSGLYHFQLSSWTNSVITPHHKFINI